MASFRFYPYSEKPKSKVYLRLSIKRGQAFRHSTLQTIKDPNPPSWDESTGYPKKTTAENKNLHKALTGLEEFIDSKIVEIQLSKTKSLDDISSKWVKNLILEHFSETPKEEKEYLINYAVAFPETLTTFIRKGVKKNYSENTRNKYRNFARHLKEFENKHGSRIKIKDFSEELSDKFISYLEGEKKLAINTVGHYIKRLKTILRSAASKGIQPHYSYHKIKGFEDENLVTFLNFEEIDEIIEKPMPSKRLEIAKDFLIIGCYTGQRISDLFRMKKGMIVQENNRYFIKIKQFKTGKNVRIPVHYKVKEVLKKYKFNFPPNLSKNEQSNRSMLSTLMKEVCQIAGITEKVRGRYNGKIDIYPKYKLIQNHSTRRSFCSNFYGLEGWTNPMIMQISGHQTEKSLIIYIDQEDVFYSNAASKNFEKMEDDDLKEKRKLKVIKPASNQ